MDLANAKAVITGGASGLGEATARYLSEAGASVTILDLNDERGSRVASEAGGRYVHTDVTDETSVRAALQTAMDNMGGITVAVNCAGIAWAIKTLGRDGAHPIEKFQKTIDVNLVGSFNVARLAAEHMQTNTPDEDGARGVIINTASIAAFDGQKGQAAYAASKGGVVGMTLPMARDLAAIGIRINAIAPGLFLTPMLEGLPDEARAQLAADVPYPPRLGNPQEFARMAAFIVEMQYLNGEVIRLDGALRMR